MNTSADRRPRLGIVGATGAIGSQLAELLGARAFDPSKIKLFASASGASQTLAIGAEEALVERFNSPRDLSDLDAVFLCAPPSVNAEVMREGPCRILISVDCASRMGEKLELVAPGLTSRDRLTVPESPITFATPHPAAYAIALILDAAGNDVSFCAGTLMLGASSGGRSEIEEMVRQSTDLLNARLEENEDEFQRAFNVFTSDDDQKLAGAIESQAASLLGRPLRVPLTIVHVPVFHGTVVNLHLVGDVDHLADRLRLAPSLMLAEDEKGLSLAETVGHEAIMVRLKKTPIGVSICCMFDNARIAALCAVWIAECLVSSPERH
jgi:aspartate-semialdehyde dehydrogenase